MYHSGAVRLHEVGMGSLFSKIIGSAQVATGAVLTVMSGGAAAGQTVPMMAAGAGNILKKDGQQSGEKTQAAAQPQGNWLMSLPNKYLVIGGVSVAALVVALSGRR